MLKRAVEIFRSEGILSLARSIVGFIGRKSDKKLGNFYREKKYRILYGDAAPSVYNLIYVDPEDIEYMVVPALRYKYPRSGTYILDGSWDKRPINNNFFSTKEFKQGNNEPALLPFSEYGLYQSIHRHYNDGIPWKETEWYQYYISNLEETQYDSVEQINNIFESIDDLYEKIKTEGYKSQQELRNAGGYTIFPKEPADEILVDIDRTGRFLFEDGRHRLAIAKILEIERVPVRVLVRHTEWQEIRNHVTSEKMDFENIKSSPTSMSHPDLQQL